MPYGNVNVVAQPPSCLCEKTDCGSTRASVMAAMSVRRGVPGNLMPRRCGTPETWSRGGDGMSGDILPSVLLVTAVVMVIVAMADDKYRGR
jgi:hypothetical protein